MDKPVVILGAGPCGLAAGLKLAQARQPVLILEKESFVGGMGATQRRGNYLFDFGPHAFHVKPGRTVGMVQSLVGEDLIRGNVRANLFLKGRYFNYPLNASELLFKLNPLITGRIAFDFLAVSFLYQLISSPDDNFESWGVKRFGKTLYDLSFGYYSGKVWGMAPKQISPIFGRGKFINPGFRDIIKKLVYAAQKKDLYWKEFIYPKEGSGQLFGRMASQIEGKGGKVLRGVVLKQLNRNDGSVDTVTLEHQGRLETIPCRAVISTIHLPELMNLIRPAIDDFGLYTVEQLSFRSIRFLFMVLKQPRLFDAHWIYLVDDRFRFNRISEINSLSQALCPPDETVLCLEISCDPGNRMWESSDEELLEVALQDLKLLSRNTQRSQIVDYWTSPLERAYNLYDLGFEKRLDVVFYYLSKFKNLVSIGRRGLFLQNDMHDSMEMGLKAADLWVEKQQFAGVYQNHFSPFIAWK